LDSSSFEPARPAALLGKARLAVAARRGRILGEILAPGVANFCFGGMEDDTLFMMCDSVIRTARIRARGAAMSS